MNSIHRIAFVKLGEFSHANASILREIRAQFPDLAIDVIDAGTIPIHRRYAIAALAGLAASHYGAKALRGAAAIRRYGTRTPGYFAAMSAGIARRLRRRSYLFTIQTQALFDASQPGTPHFVYTDHTHLANLYYPGVSRSELFSDAWIECERSVYEHARVTFTMGPHVARSLREQYGLDASRVEWVRCGSNITAPASGSLDDARYASQNILFVGVEWQRKGGPQLLEAFRKVLRSHPQASLTIVGCTPEIDVPNCHVVGRVPLSEVASYFSRAAIFCMPTRNEPLGIVFIEATAYRLPIVATSIGALPEIVQDGVSGYLVGPDDVDALAERLNRLLGDPRQCQVMGAAGFDRVQPEWSWQRTGERIGERIRRELGDGAAARR